MAFIMEFAENLVLRLMEDPKERDRKLREHVYAVKDRCQKTKEMWALPLRPFGFWTFERHNSQLRWDAQMMISSNTAMIRFVFYCFEAILCFCCIVRAVWKPLYCCQCPPRQCRLDVSSC